MARKFRKLNTSTGPLFLAKNTCSQELQSSLKRIVKRKICFQSLELFNLMKKGMFLVGKSARYMYMFPSEVFSIYVLTFYTLKSVRRKAEVCLKKSVVQSHFKFY